jgi:fibronectin-binding autotransporter adhesin
VTAESAYAMVYNSGPTYSVAPLVTGATTVGGTLSSGTGTWADTDGDTLTYTYQWYRATDAADTGLTAISGATSSSYTLTTSDAHKFFKVVVTANDGNGSSTQTATSAYTAITNTDPTNSVIPAITGTGTWSDTDTDTLSYTYQWYRPVVPRERCRRHR